MEGAGYLDPTVTWLCAVDRWFRWDDINEILRFHPYGSECCIACEQRFCLCNTLRNGCTMFDLMCHIKRIVDNAVIKYEL